MDAEEAMQTPVFMEVLEKFRSSCKVSSDWRVFSSEMDSGAPHMKYLT